MITNAERTLPASGIWDFRHPDSFRFDLFELNSHLSNSSPAESIEWAAAAFGDGLVMTTSFGVQSAVLLHQATQVNPDIPVIWVDTGYLHEETYHFAEQLTRRLSLNLKVFQAELSPAAMEAKYGRLWESNDVADLNLYDQLRKVEPLKRAFQETRAQAWLSGVRRQQTRFRQSLDPLSYDGQYYKLLPLLNWDARDVYEYLQRHDLPYHPLFEQGYTTIGDHHSSRPVTAEDDHERDSRFRGLKEECGIHMPNAMSNERIAQVAA